MQQYLQIPPEEGLCLENLHSHSRNDSNKNSNGGDLQKTINRIITIRLPYTDYYLTNSTSKLYNKNLQLGNWLQKVVGSMRLNWVSFELETLNWHMDVWCQEIISNQHVQMRHVETSDWKSINASGVPSMQGQKLKV